MIRVRLDAYANILSYVRFNIGYLSFIRSITFIFLLWQTCITYLFFRIIFYKNRDSTFQNDESPRLCQSFSHGRESVLCLSMFIWPFIIETRIEMGKQKSQKLEEKSVLKCRRCRILQNVFIECREWLFSSIWLVK